MSEIQEIYKDEKIVIKIDKANHFRFVLYIDEKNITTMVDAQGRYWTSNFPNIRYKSLMQLAKDLIDFPSSSCISTIND